MNAIASTLDPRDAVPRPVNTNRGCLLLNASYEPLAVLPLKRAVRLLLDERAETVEVDGPCVIRSAADRLPCPAVIRLVRFVHVPRRLRRHVTNTFLFGRDRRRCCYCGRHASELRRREFLTRDHVLPISRGGTHTWENCVTACSRCNNRKADRTPEEAGMPLRITPTTPHFVELVWSVRRLTPLQRKWILQFYGQDVAEMLER